MNQPLSDTKAIAERIEGRLQLPTIGTMELSTAVGGLSFQNMLEVMEFAKMMAISGVAVPPFLQNNPGACLAVTMQAFEWGFSPFSVANKSYSVNNRMAYESQLVQAVILKRAPIQGRLKVEFDGEGVKRRCRVWAVTTDGETVDFVSPEVGKITVKNSPLWKSDEDQQLFYYSARGLCRRHFPDVILGVYTREEIETAAPLRTNAPEPTGLASRLSGASGGFSASIVADALATAQPAADSSEAEVGASATANKPVVQDAGDVGEARRQGARAALAGDDREAPGDATDAEKSAWLDAFDAEAGAAERDGRA